MENSEIAILISVLSAAIAATSLGWNIYRDVILKPRVKIDFSIRTLLQQGRTDRPEYVIINATNHGPGLVNLSMIQLKNTSLIRKILRKQEYAVVLHDYENHLSGQLPHKLDVGEKIDFLLPFDAKCLLSKNWSHVGLSDTYGRIHWADKAQVKKACERWKNDFGTNNV